MPSKNYVKEWHLVYTFLPLQTAMSSLPYGRGTTDTSPTPPTQGSNHCWPVLMSSSHHQYSISFPHICWVHTSKNIYSWFFSKSSILGVNPLPSISQVPALPKPNHWKVFFQSASTRTPTRFHVLPRKQLFSSMSSLLGCLATTGCFPPLLQFWPLLEERAPRRAGLLAPSSSHHQSRRHTPQPGVAASVQHLN